MTRIFIFSIMLSACSVKGQSMIDSLYALLHVQSYADMIHVVDSGFFTIGYGTDVGPFNSYGTLFTSFDFEGKVKFSTFTLDSNQLTQYNDINMVVIDSFAYTIHVGTSPDALYKINIHNGQIVYRKEYPNMAGGTKKFTFARSVHLIDTNTILLNVIGYAEGNQLVTQLCRYSIPYDTFEYFFNTYPGYNQDITDLVQTSTGYILSGYLFNGNPSGASFHIMATVVWLDKAFHELRRYISPEAEYQGFGFNILREDDGSLILTNCIGRQYYDGWSSYFTYTFRPSIYKLNGTGELQWQTPMGRKAYYDDVFWFSALLPSNLGDGYIAAGSQPNFTDSLYYSTSDTLTEEGENLRFEALIAKVSNQGDSLWSRSYYTADFLFSRAEFRDMVPHPDGGYLLCGVADKLPWDPEHLPVSYTWILHVDEYGCAVPGCQNVVKTQDPALPDPIRFYPNPATNELYIYQQEDECIDYSITDMQGRLLHHYKNCHGGSTGILDISGYLPGSYVLIKKDQSGRIRSEVWVKPG